MNIQYISGLLGLDTLHSPRIVNDSRVIDCQNVLFRDGTIKRRWGYIPILPQIPTQDVVRHIIYFNQFEQVQYSVVVVTERDIFCYDASNVRWLYISPVYTTGSASCSGSTVTGSGTSWSANVKSGDEIKFGTTNPNGSGTWYTIANVNSNTSLTISGSATVSSGSYVIRQKLAGGASDWTIAVNTAGDRILIVTNGSDMLYWDGSNQFVRMQNVNPAYKCGFYGSMSGQHLLLGHTIDSGVNQPCTIEISNVGNPLSFSEGHYIDLYDSNDKIQGFTKIRDYIAVYKEHSITLLVPTYTEMLFDKKENVVSIGTVSIRTVGSFGNYNIFMGQDNVYVFDGVNVEPIGDEIKNSLFGSISWDYIHKSFAFVDAINNLYMLFVPTGTAEEPNICYVYDLYCKAWTVFKFGHTITAAGDIYLPISYSWDDITARYNASGETTHTWQWFMNNYITWNMLKGGIAYRTILFGDANGNIYKWDVSSQADANVPIRASITTKDYSLNEPYKLATVGDVRLYMEHQPVRGGVTPTIGVRASMNYGTEWSEQKLVDMVHPTGIRILDRTVSFALRGNYLRLHIANTSNGDNFSIEGIAVLYNDAGV